MAECEVIWFADNQGAAPALDWMDSLPSKVRDKLHVRVERLMACGHELRRPEAAPLRDGINELRVRWMNVNYRLLYFFHEGVGVLCEGTTKDGEVPEASIERALRHQADYVRNPVRHTYSE